MGLYFLPSFQVIEGARTMPSFVATMESTILQFMESERGRHALPVMPRVKRALVHEIASNHGLDSQADICLCLT